jgi:pseudouridine synthase
VSLQRLQKILSQRGYSSRRVAEGLISRGKVSVNGRIVRELGAKADPELDSVEVDPAALKALAEKKAVLMLNKPLGYVSTRSKAEGAHVMELIQGYPEAPGFNPIGRLDKDSSGLLLLTNDGTLQYAIVNPESHLEKEYEVRCGTAIAASQLKRMAEGVNLDGKRTRPAKIFSKDSKTFRIILTEGKNRQIRRMAAKVGLEVEQLRRLRIGPIRLENLNEGSWRELSSSEVELLRKAVKEAAQ